MLPIVFFFQIIIFKGIENILTSSCRLVGVVPGTNKCKYVNFSGNLYLNLLTCIFSELKFVIIISELYQQSRKVDRYVSRCFVDCIFRELSRVTVQVSETKWKIRYLGVTICNYISGILPCIFPFDSVNTYFNSGYLFHYDLVRFSETVLTEFGPTSRTSVCATEVRHFLLRILTRVIKCLGIVFFKARFVSRIYGYNSKQACLEEFNYLINLLERFPRL